MSDGEDMTRNIMLLIVLGTVSVLILAGVSKVLDSREIDELKAAATSLRLHVAATNVRLETYSADSVHFAAARDSFDLLNASLRHDLKLARGRTRVVVVSRDSARATIEIDTLTPQLRNMIVLEREAAVSFRRERDILARSVRNLEAKSVIDSTELAQLGALIRAVRAERDSAMKIIAGHEGRLGWSFGKLFQDLPRKAACAGAGAIVAEINDGEVLLGAVIGLATCLVVGEIL